MVGIIIATKYGTQRIAPVTEPPSWLAPTPIAPPTTAGAFTLPQAKPTPNGIPQLDTTNQNTLQSNPANAPAPWVKQCLPSVAVQPAPMPRPLTPSSVVRRAFGRGAGPANAKPLYVPARMG